MPSDFGQGIAEVEEFLVWGAGLPRFRSADTQPY